MSNVFRSLLSLQVLMAFAAGSLLAADKDPNIQGDATAKSAAEMKPYKQRIPGTDVWIEMVPIRGGEYLMGSPASEKGRKKDEGPQH